MSMSLLSELVGDGGAAAAPSGSRAPRSEAELDRRGGVLAEDDEEIFSSDEDREGERVLRRSWAPEEGKISAARNKDRR